MVEARAQRASTPLVWLPFDPAELGDPPAGLRYEVVDPTEHVPASVDEVAFYVTPYRLGTQVADALRQMSSLEVVQTLTAGVDSVRSQIPEGVTLCSGRGIHDSSTAELALTLILSSLRGVPEFVRAHDRSEWRPRWRPALADRQVLLVGYGAIGQAIEARLVPFEATVTRVARSARDGVHAIGELPDLLPEADVVVLIVPLTDETRGLVDDGFLARMKDGSLLVNVARGGVVDTDALHCRAAHRADHRGPRRLRHRAASRGPPAVDDTRCPAHPARRWREQRDVAARPSVGPRPAASVRRRATPRERHDRAVLALSWVGRRIATW